MVVRVHTQMCRKCVSGMRMEYDDRYYRKSQCDTSTSISGDLWAACHFVFPRPFPPCLYRSRSPALHAGENSIFPWFFHEKRLSTLQSRNMIAPLYIKQNEETAEKPNALFRCSVIKERNYAARFISARPVVYFLPFLFSRTKFAISRHGNVFMMSSSSFG